MIFLGSLPPHPHTSFRISSTVGTEDELLIHRVAQTLPTSSCHVGLNPSQRHYHPVMCLPVCGISNPSILQPQINQFEGIKTMQRRKSIISNSKKSKVHS